MLQMLVLEPKLAILDEVDSGLDIDALKIVANAVNHLNKENKMSVLIITHYTRILNYIQPDYVHVMKDGKIVEQGSRDNIINNPKDEYTKELLNSVSNWEEKLYV